MSRFLLYLFLPMFLHCTAGTLAAAQLAEGEALHKEHCQGCHNTSVYTRAERIVTTLPALRERVRQCELMNDLLWFEEDVDAVTAYLNADFYLFGIK